MSNPENTPPDLAGLRLDYRMASLRRNEVSPDPFVQFRTWFDQAHRSGVVEANAMTLATCGAGGEPSARIVLLKGLDDRGFTFFTNYGSRKGRDLAANPRAALTFFWRELERQVSVRGSVERVSREESEDYFRQRPYDSRIGAHVSQQSSVIPGRQWLEERFAALRTQYPAEVPLPDTWGGFRLVPDFLEFWQGRPGRLHDRICYIPAPAGGWQIDRLSP